ncbi:MAG: hypothetical protein IH586_19900 [Anaerolineaceae bacterium]|nr:hypothetical protein [Anaerolineaceae bacterium]
MMIDLFPAMNKTIRDVFLFPVMRVRNAVDYPLRQMFRWQRGKYTINRQVWQDPFSHLPPSESSQAREAAKLLHSRYRLEAFYRDSTPINYRENLYYLQMLQEALNLSEARLPETITAADIGPSHWFYVQALHALLKWWDCARGRQVMLKGYEVDAYRVYGDYFSRHDHALGHMRGLPGVDYIPHGFQRQENNFDLITMLFPFVFERDHLQWGLPATIFRPQNLLEAAWESIKPGGVLLIVNQGVEEHEEQKRRLLMNGIPVTAAFHQDPLLFQYELDRYVLVCHRDC